MIKRIGRYEVQAELGRGGFGQVFRAYDPTVGRLVAIKTLTGGGEPDLLTRFKNEAAATGKLRHPNIVIIYDFGDHAGTPYIVMELLDGEDLERLITSNRSLTLLEKLDILKQVGAGLHHAHSQPYPIIHRDIKPANIMRMADATVKIMDFGIALVAQATAARITPQGSIIGTFPYMSPEQFSGTPADALTDLFAYGVTSYKLLTGVHPFQATEMGEVMYNIMNKTPVPIRALSPECPEVLEQVLFRTLAKDRDARYQSLEDVLFDLEPIVLDLRKEHVGELLNEVKALVAAEELEKAQATVRQVLGMEPGNRTARELRELVQQLLRDKVVRPRVVALVDAGRQQLKGRRFDEAIQNFESALRLDKSNPEVQALISDARASWENAQRADRLVEQAHHALNRGDLTVAQKSVAEALSVDPRHTPAERLLATVRDRIAIREAERRLREGLSHAKGLMLLQSSGKAIEILEGLQAEYPDSTEARELLLRARAEQEELERRERLQAGTDAAKDLLRNRRLAEAIERLAQLRTEFPDSPEVRNLGAYAQEELRAQEQAEAIALATEQAHSLVDAAAFEAALDVLGATLSKYPGAAALRDLVQGVAATQAEHQRNKALNEAVEQASVLISESRFSQAVERLGLFVRAYGDTATLDPLRRQAVQGLERQRRDAGIRKVLLEARALLDDGRPETATKVLRQGTVQFQDDPGITQLLAVASHQVRERKLSEAVSKIITEAESLARARQFDHALQVLDQALEEYAGNERLMRCREATLVGRAGFEREESRRQALDSARRLRSEGKFSDALETIHAALKNAGGDLPLLDLKRQIEAEQETAAARTVVDRAQRLLDRGDISSATQILQAAVVQFPTNEVVTELMALAEARGRERHRADNIATLLRDAEAQIKTKLFDPALHLLNSGLREHGPEMVLVQAREAALRAKTVHEREHGISEALARAEQLRGGGDLSEALRALEVALKRFADEARLLDLKKQIESEQAARRRIEELGKLVREAHDLLNRDDPAAAVRLIEEAAGQTASEGELPILLEEARARMREIERCRAIEEIEQHTRNLCDAGEWTLARNTLDTALEKYPEAEPLLRARKSVAAGHSRARFLAEVSRLHDQGSFGEALKLIDRAIEESAQRSDTKLTDLRQRIEADQNSERLNAIRKAESQARSQLTGGCTEAAIDGLKKALLRWPGEHELSDLLRLAEETLHKRKWSEDLEKVRRDAESLLAEGRYDQVIALIEEQFAGEAQLADILDQARGERALQDGESQVVEVSQNPQLVTEPDVRNTGPDRIVKPAFEPEFRPRRKRRLIRLWIGIAMACLVAVGWVLYRLDTRTRREFHEPHSRQPLSSDKIERTPGLVDLRLISEPEGVSATLDDQTCTTPCELKVRIGSHSLSAHLPGYVSVKRLVEPSEVVNGGALRFALKPELRILPASLNFTYKIGDPAPAQKTVSVVSEGAEVQLSWPQASTHGWVRLQQRGAAIAISADPRGLLVGQHTTVLRVRVPGVSASPTELPITLDIQNPSSKLARVAGPVQQLRWSGVLNAGEVFMVRGRNCSPGQITAGELPSAPIQLEGLKQHLEIVSVPTSKNGYQLQIRNVGSEPVSSITLLFRELQ